MAWGTCDSLSLLCCTFAERLSYFSLSFWITVIFNHLPSLRTASDRERWQYRTASVMLGRVMGMSWNPHSIHFRLQFCFSPHIGEPRFVSFVTNVWRNYQPSVGSRIGLGRSSILITGLWSWSLSLLCPVGEALSQWQPYDLSRSWEGGTKMISS